MGQKIDLDGVIYDVDLLSEETRLTVDSLNFTRERIKELYNMHALLQRAKNSYIESIKKEALSSKAGMFFENNWKEITVPKITIDNIEYNSEDLSENGKAQLASLQFLEVQMQKIKAEIAVYQTARNSYTKVLKKELESK